MHRAASLTRAHVFTTYDFIYEHSLVRWVFHYRRLYSSSFSLYIRIEHFGHNRDYRDKTME